MNYVIYEPLPNADEKVSYKYINKSFLFRFPFVAAELLSSDTDKLIEYFFLKENPQQDLINIPEDVLAKSIDIEDDKEQFEAIESNKTIEFEEFEEIKIEKSKELVTTEIQKSIENSNCVISSPEKALFDPKETSELLEKLFSYISNKSEDQLNPVLTGYFAKIVINLLEKKRADLWNYLLEHKKHIENLIKCSTDISIAELLNKLIKDNTIYRKEIINEIISLNIDNSKLHYCNALLSIIKERIELAFLLESQNVQRFYSIVTSKNKDKVIDGLKIIKNLIEISIPRPSNGFPLFAEHEGISLY